jgi:hypothetical protein
MFQSKFATIVVTEARHEAKGCGGYGELPSDVVCSKPPRSPAAVWEWAERKAAVVRLNLH